MKINYNVISTGSVGNCTLISGYIAVDMGIPYSWIKPYERNLRVVFLTHIHSDHFNESTIRSLHKNKPALRFACPPHLVLPLSQIVRTNQIDVIEYDYTYDYGKFRCRCQKTIHNVPNVCWHFEFIPSGYKAFYATDCQTLEGIKALGYELYLVEANYRNKAIRERIKAKESQGIFPYEKDVMRNHMSLEQCNRWLKHNASVHSHYQYMHGHINEDGVCETYI